MVEFEFQPWRKIIVHEVVKFPLEHFITGHSIGVEPGGIGRPLTWANGILFEFSGLRDTDDIIREKLEGKLHWNFLHYTILEKYQPEFKVPGNIRIPVIDASNNETFRDMTTWVKNNFEKKELEALSAEEASELIHELAVEFRKLLEKARRERQRGGRLGKMENRGPQAEEDP